MGERGRSTSVVMVKGESLGQEDLQNIKEKKALCLSTAEEAYRNAMVIHKQFRKKEVAREVATQRLNDKDYRRRFSRDMQICVDKALDKHFPVTSTNLREVARTGNKEGSRSRVHQITAEPLVDIPSNKDDLLAWREYVCGVAEMSDVVARLSEINTWNHEEQSAPAQAQAPTPAMYPASGGARKAQDAR